MGNRKRTKADRVLKRVVTTSELIESLRLPVAPPSKAFKNKKRYNRKNKHKKGNRDCGSL